MFELEQKVAERYGLSGCVAFIDGTYVPILTPTVNEAIFFCRKHYHALNVMVRKHYLSIIDLFYIAISVTVILKLLGL